MGCPALHEIAAMPLPESLWVVRRFYDPCWGAGDVHRWRVALDYEVRDDRSITFEIEAATPEEAEKQARALLDDEECDEIRDVHARVRPAGDTPDGTPLLDWGLH